jgi:hypothetical protein
VHTPCTYVYSKLCAQIQGWSELSEKQGSVL